MLDPFQLYGLEPSFEVDLKLAERRHRELSRALHPDRYAARPPAERRQALGKAIEVNEGWRILRDPVRRAEALLARLSVPPDERGTPPSAPELLLQMLEWREALAAARRAADVAALEQLIATVRGRQADLCDGLTQEFAAVLNSATSGQLDGAVRARLLALVGELRYYQKLLEDAAVIQDELL